ncbi:MAG: hypothetical protein QXH57_01105 [Sulfolobales archaeon]
MDYTVYTPSDVRKLMKQLSNTLKCGEKIKVVLHDEVLVTLIPTEAVSNGLSVVDAYEFGSKIIVVVENRFNKCV